MKYEYICFACNEIKDTQEEMEHNCPHECVVKRRVPTRWIRFCRYLWTLDFGYFLAFCGIIIINSVFMIHFNYSFKEIALHWFALGLIIQRILNND